MKTIILICAGFVTVTGASLFLIQYFLRKRRESAGGNYLPLLSESSSRGNHVLKDGGGETDEYDDLIDRLVGLFETEKLCLKSNVRISEVASSLAVGKGTLSKAIKIKTGKNFCQLVHFYRVREAMRIYANHPKLTVKEISKLVGFNSQTTFITAFGRHTGCTPAEWCRQYRNRSGKGYRYGSKNEK